MSKNPMGAGIVCAEESPRGFLCSEPEGHDGNHIAEGMDPDEGRYDEWPQAEEEQG